jgi:lipoyl(octanoyl) transferase
VIHRHLGAVAYGDALALQRRLHRQRLAGEGEDTLLTLEHAPGVLTGGRRARDENLLVGAAALEAAGVSTVRVERGGDWTWHGPGQLVAYPIVRLSGLGLVSLHGLALNLDPDPWGFDFIRPCGLSEPVTSLARLLGGAGEVPTVEQAARRLAAALPAAWAGDLPDAVTIA